MDGAWSMSHELKRRSLTPPHDYSEGIVMPHTKFRADPLKTVAMHKEQTKKQTHTFIFDFIYVRFDNL